MKKHILVADDDSAIRYISSYALQEAGYKVSLAHDGEQALSFLHSREFAIDLLLTDLQMPRLSGWELIDAVQKENCTFPILVVSSNQDEWIREKLLAKGCADFMEKPIRLNRLVQQITDLLEKKSQQKGSSLSLEMKNNSNLF